MPQLTACPIGETIPIADGVCAPGAGNIDPATGCCLLPTAEQVLVIPSVYPPPSPAPNRIVYSGNPIAPRGLPASVAGAPGTALGGFSSIIPVLAGLLGAAFVQWLNKPAAPPTPAPAPAGPKVCAAGEFAKPCRPHEQLDPNTDCCRTVCPAGEYGQPCRPNEQIDPATNCCMLPAAPTAVAAHPFASNSAVMPNGGA
jgi:hypothetical protein